MNVIVSLLLAAVTIAGGSIAWPKLTDQPRPAPLVQVHELVKDTSVGKTFAGVLGISNEVPTEPINVASEASMLTSAFIKTAQERAAKIVVTQAVRQLIAQVGNLPPEEQAQIQELLCTPRAPSDTEPAPSP